MKKFILLLTIIISLHTASQAQLKIGIKAGGNISELRINGQSDLFTNDDFKGYHAGIVAEVAIAEDIYLQPQVVYSRRGAKLLSATDDGVSELRMNYVDMGANFLYKVAVGSGKLFAGAGPSFGYSFGGSIEQNGHKEGLYTDTDQWRRTNLSVAFTAGLELDNGFFAGIHSQKGLLNVYKPGSGSVKHRAMAISIGYFIPYKTKRS